MTFLLSLLGFDKVFANWLKSVPWWIPVAIVLAVVALFMIRAHDRKIYADGQASRDKLVIAQQHAFVVTLQSLDTMTGIVNFQNDQSKARAKAFTDSKAEDAKNVAAADALQRANLAQRERLQGIADHATANPTCAAPKALSDALNGL